MKQTALCILFSAVICSAAFADDFYLKNGDKITGEIISENEKDISVSTEAMGVVWIKKQFIKSEQLSTEEPEEKNKTDIGDIGVTLVENKEEPPVSEVEYKREIWMGYSETQGNNETEKFHMGTIFNRKDPKVDELTIKGNLFYSTTKKRMDGRRWDARGRYGRSFGEKKKWYTFVQTDVKHDRFTNIYSRIIPTAGLGFWFVDEDTLKIKAEMSAGEEYTNYNDPTKSRADFTVIPSVYLEKKLFGTVTVSQQISLYPELKKETGYELKEGRLLSETSAEVKINDHLKLKMGIIDEYTSAPASNTKKNDLEFRSALKYGF